MPQPMYGQTKSGKRIPIFVDEQGKFSINIKIPLWQLIFAIALQIEVIVMIVLMIIK